MAIRFRCPNCEQLLGISNAEAGLKTDCPTCGAPILVPTDERPTGRIDRSQLASEAVPARSPTASRTAVVERPVSGAVQLVDSDPDLPVLELDTEPAPLPRGRSPSFEELLSAPPATTEPIRPTSAQSPWTLTPVVLIPVVLISAVAGGLIGRALVRSAPGTTKPIAAPPVVNHPAPAQKVAQGNMVPGTVTFTDTKGAALPDRGARVLILPIVRRGSARIPGHGFRVGADETDWNILVSSVRALGGDCVITDGQGRYSLSVPTPGQYGILIVSRAQQRRPGDHPGAGPRKFLETYFERSDQMMGTSQVEFREIRLDGTTQSSRSTHFLRP